MVDRARSPIGKSAMEQRLLVSPLQSASPVEMPAPSPPVHRTRKWNVLRWSLLIGGLTSLTVLIVGLFLLSPKFLKPAVERKLSSQLGLDVTLGTMSLSIRPRLRLAGTDMVFRVPSQGDLPPFIVIDSFSVDVGPFSALRGHVSTVHLQGMKISVPPGDQKDAIKPDRSNAQDESGGKIIVDLLETRDAVLTILRRDPNKKPLVFNIHDLDVHDVGFDRVMPFEVNLTNPVPQGHVSSKGHIGPWEKANPSRLPVSGDYKFSAANLDTIRGIGGTLTSEGRYAGRLTEISVEGHTETPDFNLDLGGKPVPLTATFKAVVDGSDGATRLDSVDAMLLHTAVKVNGMIDNLPGPGGHDIKLNIAVTSGHIEDLLALTMDRAKPLLTGDVTMKGTVALPPGKGKVRDRLVMAGRFGLRRGEFADVAVQAKLSELSRRSQGKDQSEATSQVLSNMSGEFRLARSVMAVPGLTFDVPGARVALKGTFGLRTGEIDFSGTLRMQARMSQVVGGLKSVFLKPFDWLFKRDDAGTVIPITVRGTRDAPKIGVEVGKILTKKAK